MKFQVKKIATDFLSFSKELTFATYTEFMPA